jgi:class 3 adenylate cyclase
VSGAPTRRPVETTQERDRSLFSANLRREVNHSLAKGGLYAAGVGYLAGAAVFVAWFATGDLLYAAPSLFAFFGGSFGVLLSWLGRRELLVGGTRYAVMLPFVSLPTAFFLTAHFMYPGGAGTFINGPFFVLYAFVILVTGFLFSPRLSAVAGGVAAAEYLVIFALARPKLLELTAPDRYTYEDLTGWFIAMNEAFMLAGIGFATAGISILARRLVLRSLEEQHQRERVGRLFGQYVSDAVVSKILDTSAAHLGERKEVVVLFSDLRGFSTFSEGRSPEEIVARLNVYFEGMVKAIREEGGVIDKFIGDAIMAVFDGVLPHDDPANAAVRAAVGMRRELDVLNDRWAKQDQPPFDNGVGIHVGDAVQGPIGSAERKEFTVIGDAVNTAARLESLCKDKGAHLIVTDSLYEHLDEERRALFRELGETTVKGKAETLTIFGADP